jgi:flagellar basal body-associated protein FliL
MTPEVRQKAALWLALVFILGLATGGVFGYSFAHKSYAASKAIAPQMSDAEHRAKKLAEMTAEIGLTQEQAQKADAIIAATQVQIKSMRDKTNEEVEATRLKAREQMRAFLTDEQKPKFEAFVQRIDAERKKQPATQGK